MMVESASLDWRYQGGIHRAIEFISNYAPEPTTLTLSPVGAVTALGFPGRRGHRPITTAPYCDPHQADW